MAAAAAALAVAVLSDPVELLLLMLVVAVLSDPVELLLITCRIVLVVEVVAHPLSEEVGVGLPPETCSTAGPHRVEAAAVAAARTFAVVLPLPKAAVPLPDPSVVRFAALGPALAMYSTVVPLPSNPAVAVLNIWDLASSDNTVVVVAIRAGLAEIGVAQSFQDSLAMETS